MFTVECVLTVGGLMAAWLRYLVSRLRRSRPDLAIGSPLMVGVIARVLVAVLLSALIPAARGTDEQAFLGEARALLDGSFWAPQSIHSLTSTFQVWVFAQELRIPDFPEFAMRLVQIGLALTGLVLLVAAVHDLAGRRASIIAAWVVMLEPSSLFFSGLLHKESFMLLGAGIVVSGGTRLWLGRRGSGLMIMLVGAVITAATRPYAGGLLLAAVAAIAAHGAITRRGPLERRSLALVASLGVIAVIATPSVLQRTSDERLQTKLQTSQNANSEDSSNLALAPIDFSSRLQVVRNLPLRMRDVIVRPYPWELGSANQRAGLPGTLSAYAAFGLLAVMILRTRRRAMQFAGPVIYAGGALFLAFSLSSGNAGTSFRLRSTVVVLVWCAVIALHHRSQAARDEQRNEALLAGANAEEPAAQLMAPARVA